MTFNFEPQLLIIAPQPAGTGLTMAESVSALVATRGAATTTVSFDNDRYGGNYEVAIVNLQWEGNTVRWYHNYQNYVQHNAPDTTYRYLAIG